MRPLVFAAAVLTVVSLSAATAAGALGGRGSFPPQGAPPPPSPVELHALAHIVSRGPGDVRPTDCAVVPSTRHIAEQVVDGSGIGGSLPVYFLACHGAFSVDRGPPGGAARVTGTIATLTINARTNEGTDGSIRRRPLDLYEIGRPEPLPLTG